MRGEVYEKPLDNLSGGECYCRISQSYPGDEYIEGTTEIVRLFRENNGEELIQIFINKDVILLGYSFENYINVSHEENGKLPFFCVSLPR